MEFAPEQKNAFLIATSERDDLSLWDQEIAEMSGPRAVFRLVWELEAQVNNGGFAQYAHNSSGAGATRVVNALKSIGANRMAELVSQAIARLGDLPWQDDDARREAAAALDDETLSQLHALDNAFFRYDDNLTELLFDYVIANSADFPPPLR